MLAGTEDGTEPFWSPDGKSIGFLAEGQAESSSARGRRGARRLRCSAATRAERGSGQMSFCSRPGRPAPSPRSASSAATVRHVTELDRSKADLRHVRPTSLPDGRHFVYLANRKDQLIATLASVDGTGAVALGPVQSHVEATPSGHVVFVRDSMLLSQPLDVAAGRLTGDATVLADGLTLPGRWLRWQVLDIADTARLPEGDRSAQLDRAQDLRPFGEDGRVPLAGQTGIRNRASRPMAPAWPWRATNRAVPARDIWVFDLVHGTRLQLTLDAGDDLAPQWSADGRSLMFSSESSRCARHLQATRLR